MPDVVVVAPIRAHGECLAAALEESRRVRVTAECTTLSEGLARLRELGSAGVGLLDSPLLSPLMLDPPLENEPARKLVAIGVPVAEAVAWIEAGVSGCVPPNGSLDDVIFAVEKVAANELFASPEVTARLAHRVRSLSIATSLSDDRLTCREAEVLDLLAAGLSNKEIAQRLSIQVQTVKNHVHNLLVKMGVRRRAEAAAYARRR